MIPEAESPAQLAALVGQVSPSGVVARATNTLAVGKTADRIQRAKALSDAETLAGKQLDRMRSLVRIGPILGLMGTLIPISPALVGLAQGDVATLSNNLVIAFSSTVVGLLISGVAYVVSQLQSRQFEEDLAAIAYLFDRMGE